MAEVVLNCEVLSMGEKMNKERNSNIPHKERLSLEMKHINLQDFISNKPNNLKRE